jgi:hypothetical protein
MATTTEIRLSDQLKKIPPGVRPTVQAAIKTVKEVAPGASEIAYQSKPPTSKGTMWKLARYAAGGTNVVGIGTFADHATLYFYRGTELDDGSGLLQGGGKEMRFITLRQPADAGRPAVRGLVKKAFKLAGTAPR